MGGGGAESRKSAACSFDEYFFCCCSAYCHDVAVQFLIQYIKQLSHENWYETESCVASGGQDKPFVRV